MCNNSNLIVIGDSTPYSYNGRNTGNGFMIDGNGKPVVPDDLGSIPWYPTSIRHNRSANFFFFDGHAGTLDKTKIKQKLYWYPSQQNAILGKTPWADK